MEEKYFWSDKQGNLYGPFRMDEGGGPHAGDVVRHYRILKGINSKALGKKLGKSARWVQLMESNNTVPGLVSRRKAIAKALGIPLFLLGLCSDDDIIKLETHIDQNPKTNASHVLDENKTQSKLIDLDYYSEVLELYWNIYYTSTAQNLLNDIERKIEVLQIVVAETSGQRHTESLTLLCQYLQLASTVARDRRDYQRAYDYVNVAVRIADELKNFSLYAVALFRRGLGYFEADDLSNALIDLDKACKLEKSISPLLAGRIFLTTGNTYAHMARTQEEACKALEMLDKAGNFVRSGRVEQDEFFLRLNEGRYHLNRAEALIAIGDTLEAEAELQEAHEHIGADQTRRHNYIDALQARLAANMGDYAVAASTALSVFEIAKVLKSETNMFNVVKAYRKLANSPYASSKDVKTLGAKLQKWAKNSLEAYAQLLHA